MRAINPKEMPKLPQGAQGWARSTKRAGSVFHAHSLGYPLCRSGIILERNASEHPQHLGDMQYWGVCPRCYAKSQKS